MRTAKLKLIILSFFVLLVLVLVTYLLSRSKKSDSPISDINTTPVSSELESDKSWYSRQEGLWIIGTLIESKEEGDDFYLKIGVDNFEIKVLLGSKELSKFGVSYPENNQVVPFHSKKWETLGFTEISSDLISGHKIAVLIKTSFPESASLCSNKVCSYSLANLEKYLPNNKSLQDKLGSENTGHLESGLIYGPVSQISLYK
ncbi:hypothetical protein GW755_00295 [bacterium]|nr:hypothetical protein [bacterium]